MIFISQFTDERKRSVGLAFRECLASEGGRAEAKREVNRRATAPPHHPENAPKYIKSTNVTSHISRALVHVKGVSVRPV